MSLLNLRRRMVFAGLAAVLASVASGCATMGGGPEAAEKIVLERAQARWNSLLARDWNAAYPYLTAAYREVVPLSRYGNQFTGPVQWESAKATGASCEEKRCTVKVEVGFRTLLPGHMDRLTKTFVDEVWILEDGQWYKFETV